MDSNRKRWWWGLGAVVLVVACSTVASQQVDVSPRVETEIVEEQPEPVPYIYPESVGYSTWQMPDYGVTDPGFPFLPDEDQSGSRSIGTTSTGYLVNSIAVPAPHPHMASLPVQHERRLRFTSRSMLELIETAAEHVDREFPGSTVHLGNLGRPGGGDIPYSVSHNSGRDADIAFFALDSSGEPFVWKDLIPFEEDGTWTHPETGEAIRFDVDRNWSFVEGLLGQKEHRLQYIFVSRGLRDSLLDHARAIGAERDIVAAATHILLQPGGALPHNDHFHLRIYCDELDVRSGCINTGRRQPGFDSFAGARRETVRKAESRIDDDDAEVRLAAVRRLELLRARESLRAIQGRLEDDDARVRSAAVRALAELGGSRQHRLLADRLQTEEDASTRIELVDSLARAGGRQAVKALTALLETRQPVALPDDTVVDARTLVADALVRLEDSEPVEPLIELLDNEDALVVERAQVALTILTNHDPDAPETTLTAVWRGWHDENNRLGRDAWLVTGFQNAGFDVKTLGYRDVWELCRAILGPDHVSHNAQRVLMRLADKEVPSLKWSREDANFYWRRWFERRCDRFGCPPIPEGMSTLTVED